MSNFLLTNRHAETDTENDHADDQCQLPNFENLNKSVFTRGWFTLAAFAFRVQFDEDDQVVHAGVVVWVHERFVERAS